MAQLKGFRARAKKAEKAYRSKQNTIKWDAADRKKALAAEKAAR